MSNKIARYAMYLKEREGPVMAVDEEGDEINAELLGEFGVFWCLDWDVSNLEKDLQEMATLSQRALNRSSEEKLEALDKAARANKVAVICVCVASVSFICQLYVVGVAMGWL